MLPGNIGCFLGHMMTRQYVKARLKAAGISQRQAAPRLGVRFEHLNRVLNGHRESKRLLAAAGQLAKRQGGAR